MPPEEQVIGPETTPEVVSTVEEPEVPTDEMLGKETPEAPVVEAAETPAPEEAEPEKKVVPLAALHEERSKRKELAAKIEESERRHAEELGKLKERTDIILQSIQQATEAPKPSDDPRFVQEFMAANPGVTREQAMQAFMEEEPTNYVKYRQDLQDKQFQIMQQQTEQQRQQAEAQARLGNFVASYQAQAAQFATQTTDFKDAYAFLLTNRDAELQAMGFVDPMQRSKIMQNEEIGIVEQAMKDRVNPAQRLYDIAKFRGYKLPEAPAAAVAAPATLEQEKKVAAATKSLGAVPGAAAGKITAEALLNMSEEEFAAATRDNKWKEVFGA